MIVAFLCLEVITHTVGGTRIDLGDVIDASAVAKEGESTTTNRAAYGPLGPFTPSYKWEVR